MKKKHVKIKRTTILLAMLIFISACEELGEALVSTSCYCEDAISYYPATVLTVCESGYSFQCYPLGEVPN